MSPEPTPPRQPRQPSSRQSSARAKPRVLVVDDDATMRVLARHLLEKEAYEVVEAASGREALGKLRGGPLPDYLVTDLKMADGSGGWLVSQVGYEFPALLARTVVITGSAGSAAAAHVTARWQCPMVAKPFTEAELVRAIAALAAS